MSSISLYCYNTIECSVRLNMGLKALNSQVNLATVMTDMS